MNHSQWQILRTEPILTTPHWRARRDRCRTLRGHEIDYYYIERANSVHIVAVTAERKIVFVRQYRHPARQWLIEIPAGILHDNEDPASGAQRELLEETGYNIHNINLLGEVLIAPGLLAQRMYSYIGFQAQKVQEPSLEDSEDSEVCEYSLSEALELASRGEIIDGPTLAGLFLAREYVERRGFTTPPQSPSSV